MALPLQVPKPLAIVTGKRAPAALTSLTVTACFIYTKPAKASTALSKTFISIAKKYLPDLGNVIVPLTPLFVVPFIEALKLPSLKVTPEP